MACTVCSCLKRGGSTNKSIDTPLFIRPEVVIERGSWEDEQTNHKEPFEPIETQNHLKEPIEGQNHLKSNWAIKQINPALLMPEDFVHINICGTWYQPLRSTLARFPGTLLADPSRMQRYWVKYMKGYYFDRHRECFDSILYYYQSGGILIRPPSVPMDLFIKEVKFFGIPNEDLVLLERREGYHPETTDEEPEEEGLPANPVQRCVWLFVEHPESSFFARCFAILSMLVILVSVTSFCLETIPKYHDIIYAESGHHPHEHDDEDEVNNNIFNSTTGNLTTNVTSNFTSSSVSLSTDPNAVAAVIQMIETVSVGWFTFEYILRFGSSPNKWKFFKTVLNLIDFLAILPFFITTAMNTKGSPLAVIRVARLLRVFRVFKLSRHSKGLQILGSVLKSSINELGMIVFLLAFGIILFSSALYYAEYEKNKVSTFESIPNTFWYTLVTMTTVGYGDHVPQTLLGKILGGLAAIAGVLTVAMVVPVIDSNFDFFYKRDRLHEEQMQLMHPRSGSRHPSMLPDDDPRMLEYNGGYRPNF